MTGLPRIPGFDYTVVLLDALDGPDVPDDALSDEVHNDLMAIVALSLQPH